MEETIFAELLNGRELFFPGIGSLQVQRIAARLNGKNLSSPRRQIVFSLKQNKDHLCLADLSGYEDWFETVKTPKGFVLNGVGELKGKHFKTSPQFEQLLSPLPAQLKLKRATRRGWLITVLFFLIAAAVVAAGWRYRESTERATPAFTQLGETSATTVQDSQTAEKNRDSEVIIVPEQQSEPAYRIVGGVFSLEENADKYMAQIRDKIPAAALEKLPYKGKYMISFGTAPTREEADRLSRELARSSGNRDLWVQRID